jgi:hypothetical protein
MNITTKLSPNKWVGGNRTEAIVIHHWDDPAKHPKLDGVVSWFLNPESQVSAHYIVSGDTVIKVVEETDKAWHAMQANQFGIGIEIDPNVPGNTYKTAGELVRDIRKRRGNIPLKKHSDYVATSCPGNIDLNRIEQESKGEQQEMITTGGLNAIFRLRLGREPDASAKKVYLGKMTFDQVDAAVQKSKEYKELVTQAKLGKINIARFAPRDIRVSLPELTPDKLKPGAVELEPGIYIVK